MGPEGDSITGPTGAQGPPGVSDIPGATGAQGVAGLQGPAGQGFRWQGAWMNTLGVIYLPGDIVYFMACAWICLTSLNAAVECPNGSPGNPWALFSGGQFASLVLPPGIP
jgi:hypothetical protein